LVAAVANVGHNETTVNAYYHALALSPGFIRARYNLGIKSFNWNAYKQAIEHFLIALKQQNNSGGPQNTHVKMSEYIWHTLDIAINRLKRSDLEQFVAYKDLLCPASFWMQFIKVRVVMIVYMLFSFFYSVQS
jgi:peroxin-5